MSRRATVALRGALAWTGTEFEPGRALLLDDDRIVGLVLEPEVPEELPEMDWGHVALVPGTVNAHGHSFQNLLKGFADDRNFASWRDQVLYPFSGRLDTEGIYAGALFAFAEALLAGATTTVDFFYLHDEGNDNADAVIRAARDIGIRLVLARAFYDVDAPTRAPKRYRESAADADRRLRELADEYADDPLISVQPAPHSLHAASPNSIEVALQAARDLGVPCHLHLAEAFYEVDQIEERYGTSPVRLLEKNGLLDELLIGVHAVCVDDEELDMMAEAGCAVVHCPGANAFLGDGMARLPEMLRRGIRVALGPDGGCANNRQSVFDEMRMAALIAKARLGDGAAFDAATAFDLGTRAGAEVLGVDAGEFRPGAFADVVALDLDDLSLHPLKTLEWQMVNSMQQTAIAKVMVGGEVVVDGGQTAGIDLAEVRARVAETTKDWVRP